MLTYKPSQLVQRKDLGELQNSVAAAIMQPLINGSINSKTSQFAESIIKPNDRLTSLERLEIYNQQYWYRLLDSMREDFSGLHVILGEDSFTELCTAYLNKHPSTSFTLRDLGSRLPQFILEHPQSVAKEYVNVCLEMARFEWAEVVAFDGLEKPRLNIASLHKQHPGQIILKLQPHISILALNYAIDKFLLQQKKISSMHSFSNAKPGRTQNNPLCSFPEAERVFVVIHRQENIVYYKRINETSYLVLTALKTGYSLNDAWTHACEKLTISVRNLELLAEDWQKQFATWTQLGWFCCDN